MLTFLMKKNIVLSALAFATPGFFGSAYPAVSSSVLGEMQSYATSAETPGDMKYAVRGLLDSASYNSGGMVNTSGSISLDGVAQGQGGIAGFAGVSSGAFASDSAVAVTATSQVGVSVQSVSSGSMSASTSSVSGGSSSASTQGTGPGYAKGDASSSGSASVSLP